MLRRMARAKEKADAGAARLESLSPLNVLKRGYSLTRNTADGSVVRGPEQVQAGDQLETIVERGRIVSRVE
jgi:exodeoxyribonuclease VII large subunit